MVGQALKIEASVKRGVTKQRLTLQRRDGKTWTKVVGKKLPAEGKPKKVEKAVSKSISIQVGPAVEPEERLTLTTSTRTVDEQTTVTFGGDGASQSYEGTFTVAVPRNESTRGAPQLNVRAVADGAVSRTRSSLLRTAFQGSYTMFWNDQIVGENTVLVIYAPPTVGICSTRPASVSARPTTRRVGSASRSVFVVVTRSIPGSSTSRRGPRRTRTR